MRKFIAVAVVALCLMGASSEARAQELRVGVDGAFTLPIGDWSRVSSIGFGAMGKAEYLVMPNLAATGRIGLLFNIGKGFASETFLIPILAGGKYFFLDESSGPYGAAELGFAYFTSSYGGSAAEFAITVGGGYDLEGLDFRGYLFLPAVGDLMGLMASVGYAFSI